MKCAGGNPQPWEGPRAKGLGLLRSRRQQTPTPRFGIQEGAGKRGPNVGSCCHLALPALRRRTALACTPFLVYFLCQLLVFCIFPRLSHQGEGYHLSRSLHLAHPFQGCCHSCCRTEGQDVQRRGGQTGAGHAGCLPLLPVAAGSHPASAVGPRLLGSILPPSEIHLGEGTLRAPMLAWTADPTGAPPPCPAS